LFVPIVRYQSSSLQIGILPTGLTMAKAAHDTYRPNKVLGKFRVFILPRINFDQF
jgi:hypothetical protein